MIKNSRVKLDFTQEVLAEKLNISVRHIQRLENEKKRPSISLLIKLIKTLSWNSNEIVTYLQELSS